jgi:hypothetical protein
MAARASIGMLVTSLLLAAPAGAQTRARDLPPELFEPLTPDRAADESSGLPLWLTLGLIALVALAGFVVGDRMPALTRRGRARRRFEACWIGVWRSGTNAEFRAVVGHGADRWVVGCSPPFPVRATGPIPQDEPARAAYEELVARLEALGWEPAGAESDVWYQLRLEQRAAADLALSP